MAFGFEAVMAYSFLGNNVMEYSIFAIVFAVILTLIWALKHFALKKIVKFTKKTKSDFDDFIVGIIEDIGWPLYILIAMYIAVQLINTPDIIHRVIYYLVLILGTYYVLMGIHHIIDYAIKVSIKKKDEKSEDSSSIYLLGKILKLALWIIGFLLIISNLGYDITTLIAGLGIGGLAIAFALQNVLGDIFASFSIHLDKPFQEGDFIIVGDDKGTVKHIGIKSTRIKTLEGQELVVSNKELTEARVHNYKKMKKRRVSFKIGVTYQTPLAKMKKIPGIMKKIIDRQEHSTSDRVHFREFGDYALIFEVVFFMEKSDFVVYMDTRQAINLEMMAAFQKEKIEFAYPTQTLFLDKA
jgi:small-conductance mechanosensitive channel